MNEKTKPRHQNNLKIQTSEEEHKHLAISKMRINIICTIGPSSRRILEKMVHSGMSVARLNFSHGTYEQYKEIILDLKKIRKDLKISKPAIAIDTKGPELRLKIKKDVQINVGETVTLSNGTDEADFEIQLNNIAQVQVGQIVLFDDGKIQFEVIENKNSIIKMISKNSHFVKNNKAVNIPGILMDEITPTKKDIADINFGLEQEVDMFFLSFVNTAEEVRSCRKLVPADVKTPPLFISKIESLLGLQNIEEIVQESDGIMIARGDLSVEIGFENLFSAQKQITAFCKKYNKPFIMATQMLESMCESPVPYRSEISDIGNAVLDMCDCTMLSGESAGGKYPLESVEVMKKIILDAENYQNEIFFDKMNNKQMSEQRIGSDHCLLYGPEGFNMDFSKEIPANVLFDYPNIKESFLLSEPEITSLNSTDVIKIATTLDSFTKTRIIYPFSKIHVLSSNPKLCNQINIFSNAIAYLVDDNSVLEKVNEIAKDIFLV